MHIESNIESLQTFNLNELPELSLHLVEKAKQAADKAYAPYSGFAVGASLQLENGEILMGNNQENVVYPAGICAERVVMTYAHANWPELKPVKMAVVAKKKEATQYSFVTPCGICRQTIAEYERIFKSPIEIYMLIPGDRVIVAKGIDSLLPIKFSDF
ncbi:MAG TPA: cytidine deaminase [Cyclobacteriaceae bacterium]|nr:cytidine deaminase [Cyclobacteriaceae bacterium]